MEVLIGQRELLESEIDKIIFIDHSGAAFDLIKSSRVCKFKYENGEYLIDKLCDAFKNSIINCDEYISYYRRLIFDVLTTEYFRSKRFKFIIKDFESFKDKVIDKKDIECLLEELRLFRRHIDKNVVTRYDIKKLQKGFGVSEGFPCIVESASRLKYNSPSKVLRNRCKGIITLDYSFKTAYDDAIFVKKVSDGYILSIYITDVASYLGTDSNLYFQALKKGASIYTDVDSYSYIPMLPVELTRDFFSLNAGSDKMVIEHRFKISNNFEVVGCTIGRTKIRVSKNYSYDSIEKLENDDSNYDTIYLLRKLTDGMRPRFNLDYHVAKEKLSTVIRSNNKKNDSTGSSIITIATLLLNSHIAQVMNKSEYPFIYRVNDTSLSTMMLNSSIYSVDALGHVVNNGNCYGRISNPIRDFASLLNQRFELEFLVDKNFSQEFLGFWLLKLPKVVSELNARLDLNAEYRDSIEKIFGKQLTRKK